MMFEFSGVLATIFLYVLVRNVLEQRAKERLERIRMLEAAIQNPAVDRAIVSDLARQLEPKPWFGAPLLLAAGWLTMFVGIGLWLSDRESGAVVALIGFAVVTYPLALRELQNRRPPG